jgi:MATE family multidrug resistance protein
VGFPVHVAATWLLVRYLQLGVVGAAMAISVSWSLITGLQLAYVVGGGCPETWRGFSALAFVDLKDFVKLSAASGVMLWYVHQFEQISFGRESVLIIFLQFAVT